METYLVPKKLMQALYYPAVLGTGLVLFINKVVTMGSLASVLSDPTIYFGLQMLAYFSLSYIMIEDIPDRAYSGWPFALDLIEIVLVFLCFSFLGFLEPAKPDLVRLQQFYLCLATIPVLQLLWNIAVGVRDVALFVLGGVAMAFLVFAAAVGRTWPWFNGLAVVGLTAFMVVYAWAILQETSV